MKEAVGASVLKGCTAVVTGASSGIGRAIALELAAHGATLCLVGRSQEALVQVSEAALARGAFISIYRADIASDTDLHALARSIGEDHGAVDILIHSAGTIVLGAFEHAPVEAFDRQYRVNVRAPFMLTQGLLPMIKSCRGQIVFINSSAGLNARANASQYAATKHALKAVADSLRAEVNTFGIKVLSVYPGRTATPMQAAVHAMEGRPYQPEQYMQPEDVASAVVKALLLDRTVEITDIALRPLYKSQ